MKKYGLGFFLILGLLTACEPAPTTGIRRDSPSNSSSLSLATLAISDATTPAALVNRFKGNTTGIGILTKDYSFHTDATNLRFVVQPLLTDVSGCQPSHPSLSFYITSSTNSGVVEATVPFVLSADTDYSLRVRMDNILCTSVDMSFAVRLVPAI